MDFSLRNIVTHCLDFQKPESMVETVHKFLEYIFKQPQTTHNTHILMGLFCRIQRLDTSVIDYSRVFMSEVSHSTFAEKISHPFWMYQTIPVNSKLKRQVVFIEEGMSDKMASKLNVTSEVLDIVIANCEIENKGRVYTIETFIIDLRSLLLNNLIALIFDP